MPERKRLAALASLALIALGAWRLYAIVAASPMLGYANQFDMRRTSACIGLWPAVPAEERLQAHPQAPIALYLRGERRPDECYLSTELVFAAAVAALASLGDGSVDLRVVGAAEATALVLAALLLHFVFSRRPAWALMHAVVFAIVVCDPMNGLWLNTLYTEFSALFFAYLSIALLVAIAAREPQRSPAPPGLLGFFALSLVGLGLSRQQHFLLPALLALPAVLSMWTSARRRAAALVAVVAAVAFVQLAVIGRHPTIVFANNADVALGALLPASRDAVRTADRLELPARCLQSVGATWYQTMGESLEATCPEALSLPRGRLIAVVLIEPATALRALLRGLPLLQDWRLGYLGAVEGEAFAGAERVRAVAGPAAIGVASWVTALAPRAFVLLLAWSLALLVVSAVVCFSSVARDRAVTNVLYALTATAWYAIATAIFGDGYVELSRHAQLAAPCLYASTIVASGSLFAALFSPAAGSKHIVTAAVGYAISVLAGGAVLWLVSNAAMQAAPMAFGVIDRPARNNVSSGPLEFAGWALDPSGVARVELILDEGRTIEARYGLPYVGARGEPLRLYFPSYPEVEAAGFIAELPAELLAHGAVNTRTVVVGNSGTRTEIDRRRVVVERR